MNLRSDIEWTNDIDGITSDISFMKMPIYLFFKVSKDYSLKIINSHIILILCLQIS